MQKIFAKSFRTKQENDWPIRWCISSHTQKLKLLSNSGQKDQASTGNEDGFMTAASSSEDKLTEDETEQRSPTSIKLISPDLQNILGTHILKIGVNPNYPVDISGGRHTIFVYCDLIQDQILGNKLTSLLRTIALPNNSTQKTQNAIICNGNLQSFSNLQWKNVVKSSFQSINITIRDETGQLMPFLSIGRNWLTLKFQFLPNQTKSFFSTATQKIVGLFGSMDAHYEAQIARNQENFLTHGGPARQFGSGAAGLGALAIRIGRCTLPLLQKYALPFAKKMGRNLITAAIPEIGQMIAGKKLKSAAKDSLKKSVSKTISESTTADRSRARPPKRLRSTHASRGSRVTAPSARQAAGRSATQNPLSTNKLEIREIPTRKRPAHTTLKTTKTKRSRSHFLSNVRF